MCVLVVADKRRPTDEEMMKMGKENSHGSGIAWREQDKKGVIVKWEKGLSTEEAIELAKEVPMPFALHFRKQSCGGIAKEITHPFPVEKDVSTALQGGTRGNVLFHNGHWGPWRSMGIEGALKNRVKVPSGKWTDTRVMAWLAHMHGPDILELIDEKTILFGPERIEIFHPDGWTRVNDLLVSNRLWEHQYIPKATPSSGTSRVDDGDDDYYCGYGAQGHHGIPQGGNRDFRRAAGSEIRSCRCGNCIHAAVGGTDFCSIHQPPCKFAQCVKPRVVGSEFCYSHQPLCTETMCGDPRIFGEKFCIRHKALKEIGESIKNDRSADSASVAEPGGSSAPLIPFRAGTENVQEGTNQPDAVRSNEQPVEAVAGVGTQGEKSRVLGLSAFTERAKSIWARGINESTYKTPHPGVM